MVFSTSPRNRGKLGVGQQSAYIAKQIFVHISKDISKDLSIFEHIFQQILSIFEQISKQISADFCIYFSIFCPYLSRYFSIFCHISEQIPAYFHRYLCIFFPYLGAYFLRVRAFWCIIKANFDAFSTNYVRSLIYILQDFYYAFHKRPSKNSLNVRLSVC